MPTCVAQLILIRGDKLALGFRQNVKSENNVWGFPGGRQEAGETIEMTAMREAYEEVGVVPAQLTVLCTITDSRDIEHTFFMCEQWQGDLRNCELERCREVKWFDIHDLPTNCSAITYQAVSRLEKQLFTNNDTRRTQ